MVLMEADAAGRPVIASTIAGVPELVARNRLAGAGRRCRMALACAIRHLAATPPDRLAEMGRAARACRGVRTPRHRPTRPARWPPFSLRGGAMTRSGLPAPAIPTRLLAANLARSPCLARLPLHVERNAPSCRHGLQPGAGRTTDAGRGLCPSRRLSAPGLGGAAGARGWTNWPGSTPTGRCSAASASGWMPHMSGRSGHPRWARSSAGCRMTPVRCKASTNC
jgi:hypothetical protein